MSLSSLGSSSRTQGHRSRDHLQLTSSYIYHRISNSWQICEFERETGRRKQNWKRSGWLGEGRGERGGWIIASSVSPQIIIIFLNRIKDPVQGSIFTLQFLFGVRTLNIRVCVTRTLAFTVFSLNGTYIKPCFTAAYSILNTLFLISWKHRYPLLVRRWLWWQAYSWKPQGIYYLGKWWLSTNISSPLFSKCHYASEPIQQKSNYFPKNKPKAIPIAVCVTYVNRDAGCQSAARHL